jgi:hypothetical protein
LQNNIIKNKIEEQDELYYVTSDGDAGREVAMKKECMIGWNASRRLASIDDTGRAYAEQR